MSHPLPGIRPGHVDMAGGIRGQGAHTGAGSLRLADVGAHLRRPRPAVVGRRHEGDAVLPLAVIRPGDREVLLGIGHQLHGALDVPAFAFHAARLPPGPAEIVRGSEGDAAPAVPGIEPDAVDMALVVATDLGPGLHDPPLAGGLAAQRQILREPGRATVVRAIAVDAAARGLSPRAPRFGVRPLIGLDDRDMADPIGAAPGQECSSRVER